MANERVGVVSGGKGKKGALIANIVMQVFVQGGDGKQVEGVCVCVFSRS